MSRASMIGAILTGGSSSRMGRPKQIVDVAGRTMGTLVAAAVTSTIPTVVSVGRHPIIGTTRLDDGPGVGPLAAFTGLTNAWIALGDPVGVFITAVDHPWLRPETIAHLLERFDCRPVVPLHEGVRQVLCAVYPKSFVISATDQLRSVQAALDSADVDDVTADEWQAWDEDGRSWFSTDRIEDVEAGLARFGPPGHI